MQVTYAPDESLLFWSQKPEYLQLEASCREENGANSWISGLNLWTYHVIWAVTKQMANFDSVSIDSK